MLPSPASKRAREACLPVVNECLLAISCTVPKPDRHRPWGKQPAPLPGPDEGGNKNIFRKEGQQGVPNRLSHNWSAGGSPLRSLRRRLPIASAERDQREDGGTDE